MKSFFYKTLIFFLQKVLFLLHFASCQNCMSSAKFATENHQKLCNKRVLSTGEPCTCEYVTLLQSFHRGTLNIHWYIAQNFQPTFPYLSHLDAYLGLLSLADSLRWIWQRHISYFVFIYILPLVLFLISLFQIHNLELAR